METSANRTTEEKKPVAKKDEKETSDLDIFQTPSLPLCGFIVLCIIFYWFVCYRTDVLPLQDLGPVGKFVLYLANNYMKVLQVGFRFLIMVHIFEGGFAYRICRRMKFSRLTSFKWLLQTAVVGFPSLGLLLKLRTKRQEKKSG